MSAKCPICGKPVQAAFRPFCSDRCKRIDLNRWLSEAYRVPDRPGSADDDAETAARPGTEGDPEDEA